MREYSCLSLLFAALILFVFRYWTFELRDDADMCREMRIAKRSYLVRVGADSHDYPILPSKIGETCRGLLWRVEDPGISVSAVVNSNKCVQTPPKQICPLATGSSSDMALKIL